MKLPNRQKTQFSLIYLFIALMVVMSVQSWLRAPQTVDIPMSQFLALVREGKVLKVTLGEREIQGIAKPGSPVSRRPRTTRSSASSRPPRSSSPAASSPPSGAISSRG